MMELSFEYTQITRIQGLGKFKHDDYKFTQTIDLDLKHYTCNPYYSTQNTIEDEISIEDAIDVDTSQEENGSGNMDKIHNQQLLP